MSAVTKPRRKASDRKCATERASGCNGDDANATENDLAKNNGKGECLNATDADGAQEERKGIERACDAETLSDSLCRALQSLERQRRFALKQCIRGENAITAFVACNAFAYHSGIPSEAEREELWKKAGKLIKEIDSGGQNIATERDGAAKDDECCDAESRVVQDERRSDIEKGSALEDGSRLDTEKARVLADDSSDDVGLDTEITRVSGVVRVSKISRKAWADYEKGLMDKMVELAGQLPVAPWLSEPECRGISLGMLATIVGESGNLSNYANPAKLWKRLFGAPIEKNGKTMMPSRWRLEKGLSSEEWEDAGYSPHRHATMQQLKENIVRQNGDGPYRRRYDEAKERTRETHPEWWTCSKCEGKGKVDRKKCQNCKGTGEVAMHPHRHAQLLAAKRFVRDLWNKWHGVVVDSETWHVSR